MGARAADHYPSPFEDFLTEAYEVAKRDETSGRCLVEGLVDLGRSDVKRLLRDAKRWVEAVLRLPPRAHLNAVFAPFRSVGSFENYVERVLEDGV